MHDSYVHDRFQNKNSSTEIRAEPVFNRTIITCYNIEYNLTCITYIINNQTLSSSLLTNATEPFCSTE